MAEILTKEERKQIAAECYANPPLFCKTFLPHWFPMDMPWVHWGALAIILRRTEFLKGYPELDKIFANFVLESGEPIFFWEGDEIKIKVGKFTLLMMPRGYSKTTLFNACVLMCILYQEKARDFIVYISEAATHAEIQLGNVKRELESNNKIKAVFGELKPEQRQGKKWAEDMFETVTGIVVFARGRGSQIRGLNHNARRPNFILVDDVEDKESVKTDEQRAKTLEWAYGDLLPAMPELDPDATLAAAGTLLHREALLMRWSLDPQFTTIRFGATDKQGDFLWPAMMDADKLEKKKQSFAMNGLLHVFYMEYFNDIRAPEKQKFKPEFLIIKPTPLNEIYHRSLAADPAISNKPGRDHAAQGVAGMNDKGTIFVIDMWGKLGATPREQIDNYFEFHAKYAPRYCGIESVAFQAALIHLMREEMFRKKQYFEIVPLTHSQKKEERVEGILQPRYANGYIIHTRHFVNLETQLLDWPNGKKDYPDVLAMCVALLDPLAASAGMDGKDLGEDEYPPLEEEFSEEAKNYRRQWGTDPPKRLLKRGMAMLDEAP